MIAACQWQTGIPCSVTLGFMGSGIVNLGFSLFKPVQTLLNPTLSQLCHLQTTPIQYQLHINASYYRSTAVDTVAE